VNCPNVLAYFPHKQHTYNFFFYLPPTFHKPYSRPESQILRRIANTNHKPLHRIENVNHKPLRWSLIEEPQTPSPFSFVQSFNISDVLLQFLRCSPLIICFLPGISLLFHCIDRLHSCCLSLACCFVVRYQFNSSLRELKKPFVSFSYGLKLCFVFCFFYCIFLFPLRSLFVFVSLSIYALFLLLYCIFLFFLFPDFNLCVDFNLMLYWCREQIHFLIPIMKTLVALMC
jgi:hypothetical protein